MSITLDSFTMAQRDHISDSEVSWDDVVSTPDKKHNGGGLFQPGSALSHRFRVPSHKLPRQDNEETKIAVIVPAPTRPWEYQTFEGTTTVDAVLKEIKKPGQEAWYRIEYEDGREEDVSIQFLIFHLIQLPLCTRRQVVTSSFERSVIVLIAFGDVQRTCNLTC